MIHAGRKNGVGYPTHYLDPTIIAYVPALDPVGHTDT